MNTASQNIGDKSRWNDISSLPELSDEQFVEWASLINVRTGMHFPVERKSFIETNLKFGMQNAGFSDYKKYYDFVTSGPRGMVEWESLVDHLTVQETCFNRHTVSYDAIGEYCREHVQVNIGDKPVSLQALSMGCATGEEAYTLAMVIDNAISAINENTFFGITALDISSGALAVARKGVYENKRLQKVNQELKEKYFDQLDNHFYQVRQFLSQRICFSRLNIINIDKAPLQGMDIIICQNLLIYFEQQRRKELLNKLSVHLKPGGILVLGIGEVIGWEHPELERTDHKDALIYRRKSESPEGAEV
ncbi:MAG: protein-glutamate O-methyltransferase CheR [Gammaproteobacteria bacterium]|nr:protein-glutamate O-methyltransferase CheR [Gammaproteobacteria bacterium]MDH5593688.1 protein-glutamate O-methyltransferase CheR [Gammaproteobacteria bacterium]MDH5613566.1 protein-glutamate O-methyltransferase CheR [Gammaproteobacteria bacterium]